jgi:xylono-1,5-lactonase
VTRSEGHPQTHGESQMSDVECVWPVGAVLGEGPLWSPAERALWFVDIKGQRIHTFFEATATTRSIAVPEYAAFVFRDARGGMICGLRSGLHHLDPDSGSITLIERVDPGYPANRLNDGFVDPQGRLWFGTMDDEERNASGSLYCFARGQLRCMDVGYVVTNGPAMSPDGRVLYHVDSVRQCVYAFDVDPSGALANKREFMRVTEPDVYPDGPAVDSAGNVWLALFGGWGVRCYSPAGELLQHIALPVARCTKIAFAGADLRSLYITTAAVGLSPEELARQSLAGGLFRTRVDIPGLPPGEFAG